ncbi:MAG: 2OG-Fe(II) oxygenase [Sulfurimonas sp.]|nr:2OG-Fe(II) oxygenase [Sulfurimonas sp.]
MNEKLYSEIINALVKDGYIIIPNALDENLACGLKEYAQNEKDFKRAGISGSNDLHLDNQRRRDKIHWLNKDSSFQSDFLAFTDGLKERINRELYMGITYYESHFAIYDEGDFYETHLDSFKNSKNRVVTTVYYLNEDWSDEDGGELVIYDENNNFLSKVTPHANTLIVFLSDKFPHEVLPAKKRRFSIAGWYRIDK